MPGERRGERNPMTEIYLMHFILFLAQWFLVLGCNRQAQTIIYLSLLLLSSDSSIDFSLIFLVFGSGRREQETRVGESGRRRLKVNHWLFLSFSLFLMLLLSRIMMAFPRLLPGHQMSLSSFLFFHHLLFGHGNEWWWEERERVLVSTVGSDFRLIVLSSKEPFVISRFLYSN